MGTVQTGTPMADLTGLPALMQLADGRFPTGGHAHSGGFEAAAQREGINDLPAMEEFLIGRLRTTGLVAAAFTAAACQYFHQAMAADQGASLLDRLAPLGRELDARTPSPVLRTVSRRLGRQLIRTGRVVWPHQGLDRLASVPGQGVHQPVGLGAVAAAAGQPPAHAAVAAAQESIAGPATAAVRLLGLDPFAVNAVVARLGAEVVRVASEATGPADGPASALPASAGYLLDVSAEFHATWEVRLFAS
ncbi:urease accessory protein [Promicromonospora umidemergens]|uniref:Urease accessory UreF family protein n=1 Tax=Promicromonospora umidemergens TaxID=629679 RepID=A0ABP8XJU7_9MICO|nr:urease accessory UreF family protein [Promicromonospora umidemergens]MCP2282160.1 urease accessory protein [Promicromonospora umidemergens]